MNTKLQFLILRQGLRQFNQGLLPVFGALCFAAVGLATASAQTTNVLTDNFDNYNAGALIGQGSWTITGTSTTNPIQVTNPGGAGYVTLANTGQDVNEAFTSAVSHTDNNSLSTSFSLTLSAAQSGGDYFAHLSPAAGNTQNFYERIYAKSSGTGYVLGISGDGVTAPVYGTVVLNYSALTQVNVVWTFVPGATNDTFALSVNGAAYSNTTWVTTTVAEPATLGTFNLRQGSASAAPTVSNLDNVSVDLTTGVSPVPEPTTVLGGVLLVGAAGWSQRRRLRGMLRAA